MKYYLRIVAIFMVIALIAAILTGCKYLPVAPVDPEIPANLKVRCPDLQYVEEPVTLGVATKYITTLQQDYVSCATRNDHLIEAVTKKK